MLPDFVLQLSKPQVADKTYRWETWDRELGSKLDRKLGRELEQGTWAGNWRRQTWRQGTWDSELGTRNWGQGTGGERRAGTGGSKLETGNLRQGSGGSNLDRKLGARNLGRELEAANWRQGTWDRELDRELGAGNCGCSSLSSRMTWAPCPHGVRTSGKKEQGTADSPHHWSLMLRQVQEFVQEVHEPLMGISNLMLCRLATSGK